MNALFEHVNSGCATRVHVFEYVSNRVSASWGFAKTPDQEPYT